MRLQTLIDYVARLPACVVAMEASCGTHSLGRLFAAHGHEIRLMSPEYVSPYVKAQKNDDRDAEGIAEAASRPTMRFVELKTQQPLAGSGFCDPWLVAFHDCVCVDEQFSRAGDQRDLMRFSSCSKAPIETDERFVPLERGRTDCRIKASTQALPAPEDAARPLAFPAFVVERSEPCEASDLFAREGSDLWHTDEDSQ